MSYYVYVILDTRKPGEYKYEDLSFEYEPFYVGRGKGRRIKTTLKEGNNFKLKKINKIEKEVGEVKVIKLFKNLSFVESQKLEIETISKIGRYDLNKGVLLNFTDGGEGVSGVVFSEESKKKMRKSRKKYFDNGNTTWNKGRQWSDEERKKLTNISNSGKKFSNVHKNKMSTNAKNQISQGNSIIKPKIVKQYTMEGIFMNEYESIKFASIQTNVPQTSIRYCCIKKLKHAGGFYWKFKNNIKI